jgi:chemotaxis family two-component system response regulator Rcp1
MRKEEPGRPLEVLLLEENPGDFTLVREVLKSDKRRIRLNVVGNGVEVLAFLRREGPYVGVARPDVILLDLTLPRKSGCQVLADVKGAPAFRHIPLVVLTGSTADQSLLEADDDLRADYYLTKPVDPKYFLRVVQEIEYFWAAAMTRPLE